MTSDKKNNNVFKRVANTLAAISFAAASLAPSFLFNTHVKAAQLTSRKVDMSSSLPSATGVTYTVTFTNATAGTVQGIVVDFCTTALAGSACTTPTGLALTASNPTIDTVTFTGAVVGGEYTLTNASGSAAAAAEVYSFTITATNPSTVGTFYARIFTFNSSTNATNYTSGTPGSYTDNGSVAMSTARDLTVTGIVTETLDFCVGADDGTPASGDAGIQNCTAAGFSSAATVGLGVIGTTAVTTPVATANGGTNTNGAFAIRTNAVNGATVSYKANLNNSSGRLKIAGVTCGLNTSTVDGCINSAGTTANTIAGEEFGMAISQMIYPSSQTTATTNLVRDGEYDYTNSNEFAWDDSASDQIATSTGSATKVMDWEVGILKFSAVSAPTTPSGAYSVSANFVALATY